MSEPKELDDSEFSVALKNTQNAAFQLGVEYALREVRRLYKTTEEFNKLVAFLRQQTLFDVTDKTDE
jgi:hypothetical protein